MEATDVPTRDRPRHESGGESSTRVMVVGAGPTGLTLAIELARRGIACRVVDRAPEWSPQSRGLAVQARTLEVFEDLGFATEAVGAGQRLGAFNVHSDGRRLARLPFEGLDSPYPFTLALEQNETERLLATRLEELGVTVERGVELKGLRQDAAGVAVELEHAGGRAERARVGFAAGCDGAHSNVRHLLGLSFEGAAYEEDFLLGDVRLDWSLSHDEAHGFVSAGELLAVVPLANGLCRLIATRPSQPAGAERAEADVLAELQAMVRRLGPPETSIGETAWLGRFRIHRRMVSRMRVGRVFLAGDAAHIHSPVGGLGLNTGVQDAHNLGWKLASVIQDAAATELLDTYHSERHPVASATLRYTDLATRGIIVARNPLLLRARRQLMPRLLAIPSLRNRLREALSQIAVRYGPSTIVEEGGGRARDARLRSLVRRAGEWVAGGRGPSAGERAPDVRLRSRSADSPARLFDLFRDPRWVLLLFEGTARHPGRRRPLAQLAESTQAAHGRSVCVRAVFVGDIGADADERTFADSDGAIHRRYGASEACCYLVRPDGYVGLRSRPLDPGALAAYLERIFATPGGARVETVADEAVR